MGSLPFALDVTPSAYVTINVTRGDTYVYPLTLRVDVEESEEVCGPANIRLNGEKLTQDVKGHGVGSFYADNDTIISAEWDFECIGPRDMPFAQSMKFTIRALDDTALTEEVSMWMTFTQTAPVRIADVGGAAYVWSLSLPFSRKEEKHAQAVSEPTKAPPIWEHPQYEFQDPEEELQVELMELEALRRQVLELEGLINERELSVQKKLGKLYPAPPSTYRMLKQCDGVECVVHTLSNKVKHTAGKLYGGVFGSGPHHGHHGPPHHGPPHHGPPHHGNGSHPAPPHHPKFPFPGGHPPPMCPPCDCAPHHGSPPPPPPSPPPNHEHQPHHDEPEHGPPGHGHHGPPPPPPFDHGIVMTLGMAAIALVLFCAIGVGYIHRRIARLTPESRRTIRRACRESREERRARRRSRARSGIRAFFARWSGCDEDEEKQAMLREGRRRRTSSASSVTMEQEIAQFRQAAYMVEGLVSAEEGHGAQHESRAPHSHSHSWSQSRPYAYAAAPP
ncbi:hypothetical protein FZEAL_10852, partial [Fusarium zealandicum]